MRQLFTLVSVLSVLFVQAQAPAGYYNAAGTQTCAGLKNTLNQITTTSNSPGTYSGLWSQYLLTDLKPREVGSGSSMVIWDIYSDNPTGPDPYNFTPGTTNGGQQDNGSGGTVEGDKYNREHSVPLSWFSGSTGTPGPATDYLHIMPTDKKVNSLRANFPYGQVATASTTTLNGSKLGSSAISGITGTVFEPIDSFKGDVARAFLYFVTRYQGNMSTWASNSEAMQAFEGNTYPSVDIPYLQVMINWHHLDPVSTKEQIRNNGALSFQGNRNPFIDSPQYVSRVWNSGCPGLSGLVLPADILRFTARKTLQGILIQWTAATEINVKSYDIERSVQPNEWLPAGTVAASGLIDYHFSEALPSLTAGNHVVYYRLKMTDRDGSIRYSRIAPVYIAESLPWKTWPNPASDRIFISVPEGDNSETTLVLSNLQGKKLLSTRVMGTQASLTVRSLPAGSYLLTLCRNNNTETLQVQIRH